MTLKQRYVTGLEKLDFASSQVSVMQQELSDLQPELIKTSAETEKLMVKIEQDTVEVEAKKEVRSIVARLEENRAVSKTTLSAFSRTLRSRAFLWGKRLMGRHLESRLRLQVVPNFDKRKTSERNTRVLSRPRALLVSQVLRISRDGVYFSRSVIFSELKES